MRRTALVLGLLLVLSTVAAVPASAAPGDKLEGDHEGTYWIDVDGFVLDCGGHSVLPKAGEDNWVGIWVVDATDVIIRNCAVSGFGDGIHLDNSHGSTVKDSTLTDNGSGVVLVGSNDNVVKNVSTVGSGAEGTFGVLALQSHGNSITAVHAEGHFDQQFNLGESNDNRLVGNTAIGGEGGFALIGSSDNVLAGNDASGYDSVGFGLSEGSSDNELHGNTATPGRPRLGNGFALTQAEGNTLTDNATVGGGIAYRLESGAVANTLRHNTAQDPSYAGFTIVSNDGDAVRSDANSLRDNTVTGGNIGFYLREVSHTDLRRNAAVGSAWFGFSVDRNWDDSHGVSNAFIGNTATGYGDNGFNDATEGAGTAGTANTYIDNTCSGGTPSASVPGGLC